MKVRLFAFACIVIAVALASTSHAWKREKRTKQPHLPGIIHTAPCKELAPGVYDCGSHKNPGRKQDKRSGRWKITVRPTDDITITAKSKSEREFEKNSR